MVTNLRIEKTEVSGSSVSGKGLPPYLHAPIKLQEPRSIYKLIFSVSLGLRVRCRVGMFVRELRTTILGSHESLDRFRLSSDAQNYSYKRDRRQRSPASTSA
jgi:hypothetical protein